MLALQLRSFQCSVFLQMAKVFVFCLMCCLHGCYFKKPISIHQFSFNAFLLNNLTLIHM